MNAYTLPAPLQEKLTEFQGMTPEELMRANVPAPVAILLGSLVNSSLGTAQLVIALVVTLGSVIAINVGQGEDFQNYSELEKQSGVIFSKEDLLQFHFELIRHITDSMLVSVKFEHMDMKTGIKTPERAM